MTKNKIYNQKGKITGIFKNTTKFFYIFPSCFCYFLLSIVYIVMV